MGWRSFLTVRKRRCNEQSKLKHKVVIKQYKTTAIDLVPSDYVSVDLGPPTWISTYQYIDPPSVSSLPKDFEIPSGCTHPLPVSMVYLKEDSTSADAFNSHEPSTSLQGNC